MPVSLSYGPGDAKEKTNGTYPVILSPKYWCLEAGVIGLRGFGLKTYAFSTTTFLSFLGGFSTLNFVTTSTGLSQTLRFIFPQDKRVFWSLKVNGLK